MSRTVAIIQARMNSTRLPGKVLMDIGGKPALQWVIDAAKASSRIDQVVVATPDREIVNFAGEHCDVFLGSEDDVLSRFIIVAYETMATRIVRLTADCPFVCESVISLCAFAGKCAVDQWPDGMDVQVFEAAWLPLGDREHVVPVNNNLPQLPCPAGNLRHIRLTLDIADDLVRLRAIAEHLPRDHTPHWRETLAAYAKLEARAAA